MHNDYRFLALSVSLQRYNYELVQYTCDVYTKVGTVIRLLNQYGFDAVD